jgi:hypothetical protein
MSWTIEIYQQLARYEKLFLNCNFFRIAAGIYLTVALAVLLLRIAIRAHRRSRTQNCIGLGVLQRGDGTANGLG